MFPNDNLHNTKAPLPDLDNTELCNEEQITKYMSIIGQLQWAVTLGRFDILAHEMSMSSLAPKIGFLERLYGYFSKTKHFAIRYRTKEPNYSDLPVQEHDWSRTVYGNVRRNPNRHPQHTPTFFGDNKSVITSATIPQSVLNKRHNMLLSQSKRCHCSQDSRFLLVLI